MSARSEKLLSEFSETEKRLNALWEVMGLSSEDRENQLDTLVNQVIFVMNKKVAIENTLQHQYSSEINEIYEKIKDFSQRIERSDLAMIPFSIDNGDNTHSVPVSLLKKTSFNFSTQLSKLTFLRGQFEQIDGIYQAMLSELQSLKDTYQSVMGELNSLEAPCDHTVKHDIDESNFVKSLNKWRSMVSECKQLKEARINSINKMASMIRSLVVEMNDFVLEKENIMDYINDIKDSSIDPASLGISKTHENVMRDYLDALKEEKSKRETQILSLKSKVNELWKYLDIPESEINQFNKSIDGMTLSSIDFLKQEISRLETLKKEKANILIENMLDKILAKWKESRLSDEEIHQLEGLLLIERRRSTPDDYLAKLEKQYDLHSSQAALRKPILQLIDRYTELAKERDEYDLIIQDTSRLLSRKAMSNIKEEEKLRLRVTKELPQIIANIRDAVNSYEQKENNNLFRVYGQPFISSTLDPQEENYKAQQAKAKEERRQKLHGNSSKQSNQASSTGSNLNQSVLHRQPLQQLNKKF